MSALKFGATISALKLADDKLQISLGWKGGIVLEDVAQSCCEHRYMTTDDKLEDFVGAEFLGFEIKDAPDEKDESGEVHEVQLLEVKTSKGSFTIKSHNEHNGYYGGFDIEAREVP